MTPAQKVLRVYPTLITAQSCFTTSALIYKDINLDSNINETSWKILSNLQTLTQFIITAFECSKRFSKWDQVSDGSSLEHLLPSPPLRNNPWINLLSFEMKMRECQCRGYVAAFSTSFHHVSSSATVQFIISITESSLTRLPRQAHHENQFEFFIKLKTLFSRSNKNQPWEPRGGKLNGKKKWQYVYSLGCNGNVYTARRSRRKLCRCKSWI